jgi:hypothetical protein
MGVNITDDNFDEFLTSYIDGENKDTKLDNEIKRHIESNDKVSRKYMSELLTKRLFSTRLVQVDVPEALVLKINNSIDKAIQKAETKTAVSSDTEIAYTGSFTEYLMKLISSPISIGRFAVPRYAFAAVIVLILITAGLMMNKNTTELNPFIAAGSEKSVMVQAMKNFHKILAGDIQPEMKSSNVAQVRTFVKDKTKFDAYIPVIDDYNLVGAVCSEYNGQMLAHIVYTSGNEVIYIYETQVNSLHCKELELPDPVHSDILKNKFYMCDKVDDNQCTMILWYKDNVLCASVSTMPKQKMYASFTSFR